MYRNTVDASEGDAEKEELEEDISSKLAFHADPDKLDEDGKPRSKVSRKMSRNESEKLRRDRLNAYIGELARLVPLILTTNRKIDKSSVLRLTVNYLRMYHDLAKNPDFRRQWRPEFMNAEHLGSMLLESTGGFLMVISRKGTLTFCTDAITEQLGHSLVDVLGNPIDSIIHPDDHAILRKQFYQASGQDASTHSLDYENVMPRSSARSFYVRMLDNSSKQNNKYQTVHIVGHLKRVPPVNTTSSQPGLSHLSEPGVCLVGVGRIDYVETPKELFPVDVSTDQWLTRHELDGKLTFSDPRCAYISGFMPEETNGMSPYALLHKDDIGIVVAAHNLFMTTGQIPMTCFRMYTKSQDIVYIRTHTHMVVDMWTSKPRYIVSINQVMPTEEGKKTLEDVRAELKEMTEAAACMSIQSVTSNDSEDESENKHGDDSSVHEPCSPLVPEVVIEAQDSLHVYIDKNRYYSVDLKESFNSRIDPKSVEGIVYDPYPPVNAASQTVPSPAEGNRSPRPVFLGASQPPSDARSVGDRSAKSRHDSFSSHATNPGSVGKCGSPGSAAESENSPLTLDSGVTASKTSRHALLQQLNRRMAAPPPQLHGLRPGSQQLTTVPAKTSDGLNHCVTPEPNRLLRNMLKQKPVELNHSYNSKILHEIPGLQSWQEMVRAQNGRPADSGGGKFSGCPGLGRGSESFCTDLGNQHLSNSAYQCSGMTSYSDDGCHGVGNSFQNGLVSDCSGNSPAMLNTCRRSPPSYATSVQEACLSNSSHGSSDHGSLSSGTYSASPYAITESEGTSSNVSPHKTQQNQLELLKEIEMRREAHEKALQALKKEYALQVKQLVKTEDRSDSASTGVDTVSSSAGSVAQVLEYSQQVTDTDKFGAETQPRSSLLSSAPDVVMSTNSEGSFRTETNFTYLADTHAAGSSLPSGVSSRATALPALVDTALDNSLLLNGLISGNWGSASDGDVYNVLNTFSSDEIHGAATAFSDSDLHQMNVDNHYSNNPQALGSDNQYSGVDNQFPGGTNFDTTQGSLYGSSHDTLFSDGFSLENTSLADKLREANLTPGQYLKLLSQLHSSDQIPANISSAPVASQSTALVVTSHSQPLPIQSAIDRQNSYGVTSTAFNVGSTAVRPAGVNAEREKILGDLKAPQTDCFPKQEKQPQTDLASKLTQRLLTAKQNPSEKSLNKEELVGVLQQLIESGDRTIIDALLKGHFAAKKSPRLDSAL